MLFGSKKQKQKPQELDVGQKFFKFAAFFFLMFVLYQMYASDLKGRISGSSNEKEVVTEESQAQMDQKVQGAFDKMYKDPEYNKIKNFLQYIDTNVDKKKGTALKAPGGYLIFVPFDLVFKDNAVPDNKILVRSDEVEFYIDYKIVQKILETPSAQDKAQAVNSDIGEIKSDVDSAEYNRLMEEIAKKNGVEYTPPQEAPIGPKQAVAPKKEVIQPAKPETSVKPVDKIVPKEGVKTPVKPSESGEKKKISVPVAEKSPATGAKEPQPSKPSKPAAEPK